MNKSLTKAEEQVMQVLWKLETGYLKDIVEAMPGRVHCYSARVSKEEYSGSTIRNIVDGYFEGSFADVVSFMVDQKDLKVSDLELLLKEMKNKK